VFSSLQHAVRALLRRPTFSLPVILILALGIGSSTALFSIVYSLLLHPLPYPQSRQILWAWATDAQESAGAFSAAEFEQLAQRNRSFASLAAIHFDLFNARIGGEPERLQGMVCTASFSAVMQTPALAGRVFQAADHAGAPRAALLSYRLWQDRFQGNPAVVGTTLLMNDEPFVIAGVMPPEFRFPSFAQLWVSAAPRTADAPSRARGETLVGRLQPGVTAAQAGEDLRRIFGELAAEGLAAPGRGARLVSLHERLVGGYRSTLYGLLAAAGLLLLIACANAANLFAARALSQQPAWSVRLALGAGYGDLLQALFAEGLLVSLTGAFLGLAAGNLGMGLLLGNFPNSFPRAWEIGLHPGVAGFAIAAAFAGAAGSSALALLRLSPRRLAESLRSRGSCGPAGRSGEFLSGMLVCSQVTAGTVLLTAALLLGESLQQTLNQPMGMRRDFFLLRVVLPEKKYLGEESRTHFFQQILRRFSALPGMAAVAASNDPPPGPHDSREEIRAQGYAAPRDGQEILAGKHVVSPGYFAALGIRLLEGREFLDSDAASALPLIIVNEKLARHFWPGRSALGQHIRFATAAGEAWSEIVGVAGDVRHGGPLEDFALETYAPYWIQPPRHMTFSFRSAAGLAASLGAIRKEVQSLDPDLQVADIYTYESYLSTWLVSRRFNVTVSRLFGWLALALAVAGVYSALSYRVARRSKEMGVRMALGAEPGQVVRLVLRQSMRLALLGILCGGALVLALARLSTGWLNEALAADWAPYATAGMVIAATVFLACLFPALRAARVDPLIALRHE